MLIYYEHIYSVKCTYMLRIYNKDMSTEEFLKSPIYLRMYFYTFHYA